MSGTAVYNTQLRRHKFQSKPSQQPQPRLPPSRFQPHPKNSIFQDQLDWQEQRLNLPKVLLNRRSKTPMPLGRTHTPKQTETKETKYRFESSEDSGESVGEVMPVRRGEKRQQQQEEGKKEEDREEEDIKGKTLEVKGQEKVQVVPKSSVSTFYSPHRLDSEELNLPSVTFGFQNKPTEPVNVTPYVPYQPHQAYNYENIFDKLKLNPSQQSDEFQNTIDKFPQKHVIDSFSDRQARTIQIKQFTRNSRNKSHGQIPTQQPSFRVRHQSSLAKINQQSSQPSAAFSYEQPKPGVIQDDNSILHKISQTLINSSELPKYLEEYFTSEDLTEQQWAHLKIDAHQERILRKMVLLEMISVLCVCVSFCVESVQDKESYLANVLHYAIENKKLQKHIKGSQEKYSHFMYRISNNNNIIVDLINKLLKQNSVIYQQLRVLLKATYKTQLSQSTKSLLLIICQIIHQHHRQLNFSTLSHAPAPFLPTKLSFEYTLVIMLDDTLIHQKHQTVILRPFTRQFLLSLVDYFELVLFSAIQKEMVDGVYSTLGFDALQIPIQRLYRYHGEYDEDTGRYRIDLAKLGRQEDKILLVSANTKGKITKSNYFYLKKWTGKNLSSHDQLTSLAETLKTIPQHRKVRSIGKVKHQQRKSRRLSNLV